VVPNTGVPPAEVLAVMFPNRDPATLATMTLADYNASFNAVQAAIQQRIQNLNASALAQSMYFLFTLPAFDFLSKNCVLSNL
jgi:hypothetical protein